MIKIENFVSNGEHFVSVNVNLWGYKSEKVVKKRYGHGSITTYLDNSKIAVDEELNCYDCEEYGNPLSVFFYSKN